MNKYKQFSKAKSNYFSLTSRRMTTNYLRGCLTKRGFGTRREACRRAMEIMEENPDVKMRVYKCPSCKMFHLTSH